MTWEKGNVDKAFKLYIELCKSGEIDDKHYECSRWFDEREVRDIVLKTIEPIGKVSIFRDEETQTIQMVPHIYNDVLSFTNEELRKELKFTGNHELHLFYFMLYIIIDELTQTQDNDLAARLYLPKEDLLEKLNLYIQQYSDLGEERLELLSNKFQVNVVGIVEAWEGMAVIKEGATHHLMTSDNHRKYVEQTVKFLKEQKLIRVREEHNISITRKMENIIQNYYNDISNKNEISTLLDLTKKALLEEEELYAEAD